MENYKYLSKINYPSDLRKLDINELPVLCSEIRSFMIDTITQIGGHLGAGLGVVELTVALHYIFNTPDDKLIFDVGHQGYPHKILTGRKELLHTIRQKDGLSGFLKITESKYDAFGCGHASTSVSAALGMSVARDINNLFNLNIASDSSTNYAGNSNFRTIAIIGDGALTGGMAYEALNNAGFLKKNIIVILNDNNISIDENVSAFSHYFNELFSSQKVQEWKDNIWQIVGKAGEKGDRVRKLISRLEGGVKSLITPGMLFEAMGFNYFGPINGNNIYKIIKMLQNIKNLRGPVFLHIITEKGKGYDLAEKDFRKLHAVGSIDKTTGLALKKEESTAPKYQDIFGDTIIELFNENKNLVVISAAMIEGTGLTEAFRKYPERVFDVGIAESHAVTFAAGMATQGIIPIVAIYSSFLQRSFDNIIHDCALQKLHVVFAIDRAGIVGEDGATHHGVFDIAYLRMIPNMVVMAPKDEQELRNMLYSAVHIYKEYCVAIRYPRGRGLNVPQTEFVPLQLGKSEVLVEGSDVCILAFGKMVSIALQTNDILADKNIFARIINARFAKPLDTDMLDDIAKNYEHIITLEDGQKKGGFGSAVLEYFNEQRYKNTITIIGIDDHFVEHGKINSLFAEQGLDANSISNKIEIILNTHNEFSV